VEVNEAMLPASWQKEIRPGTIVGELYRPLDSVGIWIPARKGPLLSTALMLVAAARTAGVRRIAVGMPPLPNGLGDPGTVAAASIAGADSFVIGNGVAIIAGFCEGTRSVPECDGIFGPGPGGIAAAMSLASSCGKKTVVGIGPTESVIFADDSADARLTACDMLNEAEHGMDSVTLLVTDSMKFAQQVAAHVTQLLEQVDPRKRAILQHGFGEGGHSAIVAVRSVEDACGFINNFAPEHLMINCRKETEQQVLERIRHAGEILLGGCTPFAAANYGIGITAVLPTSGYAKAFSGITSKDMLTCSTLGRLDQKALAELLPVIRELGQYEQLPYHVLAAEARIR